MTSQGYRDRRGRGEPFGGGDIRARPDRSSDTLAVMADPVPRSPDSPPAERRRGPLARREFRTYFIGNLVSNSGNWLQNVTIGVFMLNLTGSSFWVGLAAAGLFLPSLALALPAGVLADRRDRRRILMGAQAAAALLAALLTALAAVDAANRYAVVAIAFGLGTAIAFSIPAMHAFVPSLVPPDELADAIGLNALTFNVARAVGPVLAAAVITTLGATWAFGLNTLSFLALIGALWAVRRPPFPRVMSRPGGTIAEGLRYAWDHRRTRVMLIAVAAISISLDPITTLAPALAESLGMATGGAGWIVSSWGGGAVLGLIAGRGLIRHMVEHGLGWIGLIAFTIGLTGLGAAPTVFLALPMGVLAGVGYITATISFTTTIQADVPEEFRGRVSSLWTLMFLGVRPFAAVLDGGLADAVGPHVTTIAFGAPALAAVWLVRRMTPVHEPLAPAPGAPST